MNRWPLLVTATLLWTIGGPQAAALTSAELQRALDQSRRGEVIVVPPGDYHGQFVVRRAMVLRGAPGARLVHEPGKPEPTLWVQSDEAQVEGLTLVGTGEGTRRDHTALMITASGVHLRNITILDAWGGLWIDGARKVAVDGLDLVGWSTFPFWQRGDGIRVTGSTDIRLANVNLRYTADGVSVENSSQLFLDNIAVTEARYAIHLMFTSQGTLTRARTTRSVAGLMLMESRDWQIRTSSFLEGYRVGSAGIRQIRTLNVGVSGSVVARQAVGFEFIDARNGRIESNRIEENTTAWAWGRDNSNTVILANSHRGNLVDVSGDQAEEKTLVGAGDHDHSPATPAASVVDPTALVIRPVFDGNFWDAWRGLDLNRDGWGDTPYRFDPVMAARSSQRLWSGLFLGSPWSVMSQALPSGTVLDPRPLTTPR